MKKKIIFFIYLFLSILTAQENSDNIDYNNSAESNLKEKEIDENSQIGFNLSEEQNKNIEEEINLIKNRTGENKANLYFKNFDKKDIVLFLDGFWELNLLGTASFEIFDNYTRANSVQTIFKQQANLSLWLLLNKRFYFEVLYKDQYEKSVLAFGYFGKEDSYVKHIRIGNSGIKFPQTYRFITTGGGNIIAPGIMGTFAGANWQADTVLRYESSAFNSKTYYGKNELVKNKISINNWNKGRYFYIPVNTLYGKTIDVFVKDSKFSSWRELSRDEFYIDASKKTLNLKEGFPYGVVIYYYDIKNDSQTEVNAHKIQVYNYFQTAFPAPYPLHITEILSQIDSSVYYKTVLGKEALVLKEDNKFSVFEIASRYEASSNQTEASVSVRNSADETEHNDFNANIEETNLFLNSFNKISFIQVLNKDTSMDPAGQMFPFINDSIIYLPENTETSDFKSYILYETHIPVSDFLLPDTAIPGSIRVFKNKIQIFDFNYNEHTHILTLQQPVFSNDLIEIQWQEGKIYSDSGSVKFAGGIHWQPVNSLDIFLASSGDLEVSKKKKDFTDDYKVSAGIDFSKYNIKTGSHFGFNTIAGRNKNPKEQNYNFKSETYFEYKLKESIYKKNDVPIFSNPYFYADGNAEIDNKREPLQLHSKMEAGLDIWRILFSGILSLQNTDKHLKKITKPHVIESYGHSVTAPLYFFTAYENFFVNQNKELLRRENMLSFEKFVFSKLLTAIDYTKEYTTQKINSSVSPIFPKTRYGIFYSELSLSLNQKYKTLFNTSNLGYTAAWTNSLIDMYSQGKEDALYRNTQMKFIFNMFMGNDSDESKKVKFLGVNFDTSTLSNFTGDKQKQFNEQTKVSLSFSFAANDIFFTPVWERKILKQKSDDSLINEKNYREDLTELFLGMREQYWLFSKPVIYDMFDKKINDQIQLNNKNIYSFINLYGFNISRLISTTIKDLYIPIEFNTSLSRIVKSEKTDNIALNIYSLNFLLKYTTLNISGKYGYFDWFTWYNQDELNRKYNWNFSFGKDYFKFKLDAEHSLYYFFDNRNGIENKLGFENNFIINAVKTKNIKLHAQDWKEKFGFAFIYSGGSSLPSSLIRRFSNIPLSDSRKEKLSVEISQNTNLKKINYAVSFLHSQTTKIGEHGEIKIFAELQGTSTERNSFLLNLTLGITGKVEY